MAGVVALRYANSSSVRCIRLERLCNGMNVALGFLMMDTISRTDCMSPKVQMFVPTTEFDQLLYDSDDVITWPNTMCKASRCSVNGYPDFIGIRVTATAECGCLEKRSTLSYSFEGFFSFDQYSSIAEPNKIVTNFECIKFVAHQVNNNYEYFNNRFIFIVFVSAHRLLYLSLIPFLDISTAFRQNLKAHFFPKLFLSLE